MGGTSFDVGNRFTGRIIITGNICITFMMMLILISILFVIICFRHNRPIKAVAWSDLHIREMFVISAGLLMLMYVINYGKVLDWMASGKICAYIIIAPMLIALVHLVSEPFGETLCKSGTFIPGQKRLWAIFI